MDSALAQKMIREMDRRLVCLAMGKRFAGKMDFACPRAAGKPNKRKRLFL